jgi:hypothetical protein
MENIIEIAFKLLTELCFSASGDGDAAIVSEDYKKLADEFEDWANRIHPNRFERKSNPDGDVIYFSSEPEETIWFTNDESKLPSWVDNRLIHPWLI